MGLFGNKEDKKNRKVAELLTRYNLQELSDQNDLQSVINIAEDLAGNNLITFGTTLSGKAEDVAKLTYLSALIEQNWIIIRQLDRLNKKLEEK